VARPAIFLDRDGTLMVERDFCRAPEEVEVLPKVAEALRALREAGYRLVVVTNQSGIGRGYLDESTLAAIHERLQQQLGLRLDALLHCPHHPNAEVVGYRRTCDCRKPLPGLLWSAARILDLDLQRSHSIGDSARDILAAAAVGVQGWLVSTGKPLASATAELERSSARYRRVADVFAAARAILAPTPSA
jgi:D-glycero-D-manno-heptose 1,7-bisphosphate phosphatase